MKFMYEKTGWPVVAHNRVGCLWFFVPHNARLGPPKMSMQSKTMEAMNLFLEK